MDIRKFAARVARQGFVEGHDAKLLVAIGRAHQRIQRIAEEVHASATPVYTLADKAKVKRISDRIDKMAAELNQ